MKAGEAQGNERELSSFLARTVGACNALVQFALVPPFKVGYLVAGSRWLNSTLMEKMKVPRSRKIIPFLLFSLLLDLNICHAQPKAPLEVVMLFDEAYGGPAMDEIAAYTTPRFRDNKPKSVWVVETWKTLQDIQYERLNSSVIDSQLKGDKAIVILEAKIKALAGEVTQKEIFYLIKQGDRWLIDELVVTDEEIDQEKLKL